MNIFRQVYILLLFFCGIPTIAFPQAETRNHIIAAREYYKSGDNIRARLELDSASRLSPNNPMVNELLGDIETEENKFARAITYYDKAILANNSDPKLYLKRATLHQTLNNHRQYVINDYNAAIRLSPDKIEYYLKKASYLASSINPDTHKRDFDEAVATIREAIAIDKKNPELYFLAAVYLSSAEYFLGAIIEIDRAIALNEMEAEYYAQRSKINFSISKYKESAGDITRAIRLDTTEFSYYEQRAHTLYNLERYDKAYDDYSRAIDLIILKISQRSERITLADPLNKSLRLNLLYRGMTLVQENRPYEGCDDFERAYQMGEMKARNYMRKYCY